MKLIRMLGAALALACMGACATVGTSAAQDVAATTSPEAQPVALGFLAGEWTLHDAAGAHIGRSTIDAQGSGAVLYERRTVGDAVQPLWLINSERTGGWVQLFLNPSGQVREFSTLSHNGAWPLVLGAEARLRDGALARFRLTITAASDDESRRLLEMSRDNGASWSTVLDYTYRRASSLR